MMEKDIFLWWKNYWDSKNSPGHAFETEEWYKKYASEIRFHLQDCLTVVDAGCGNAEILVELAPSFSTLYGLDYSTSMLEEAKKRISGKGITNVQLFHSDVLNIDKVIPSSVDAIICNEVVQFLNSLQLNEFVSKCSKLINKKGRILLLNIPDAKCFDLYSIGFYRLEGGIHFTGMIAKYMRTKFYLFRKKLKDPSFIYTGDIGYWYSFQDVKEIAKSMRLNCDIYYSMFPPYGYRFHALLTNISND
jgi:cyclopropane-fatty-acyl-phospholipid synthase